MEAINRNITEMSNMFNQRMAQFEKDLQKSPSATSGSTSGLAADYAAFRAFIMQALNTLQQQVSFLAQGLDNIEMRGRRKILLLHGVAEQQGEETAQMVVQVVKQRLKIDLAASNIKRCLRMGRSTSHKPRPILFKLHDVALRDKVWFNKTKLKGSGITMSEFLTKARHSVFMAARDRFGVSQCWTSEGTVFVLDSKGSRHRITSFADLDGIAQQPEQASGQPESTVVQPVAQGRVAVAKAKRAVAKK
ncbi:hypothetical protein PYW08_012960 [Mythimna loreyi]|uniref:Uncharacterized protein n=1 Tax=Mythimna loreyi TaxID=667449 RepID=A0ACC2PZ73_9NEOP|nr:hypothetical protein PYW08_012960 [Mythimna loreyi]